MFLALFVPAILLFSIDSIQSNAFDKNTSEVGELIKEEGGVVGRAYSAVQDLRDIGYEISYSPKGAVEYGEKVTVTYKKKYKNFFTGEKELKSTQVYEILRRHSAGTETDDGNQNNNNSVIRNITLTSNKLTNNEEYLQTFTIPNLKRILNITANTGSAEVSSVSGNQVTIRMKNGDPIIEKIGASEEKRKYVEDYNQPYYEDAEGYKGTLEKYVKEGEYKPKEVKYVSGWDSEYYEDAEGFTGKLEKYLASGDYIEGDSKEVTDYLTSETYRPLTRKQVTQTITSNENSFPDTIEYEAGGFKGTLSKNGKVIAKVIDGEYYPEERKTVEESLTSDKEEFPNTIEYNKDGFSGTLSKVGDPISEVISGYYIPAITKHVTNQDSPYYKDEEGYEGTLEPYVISGSPAESKTHQMLAKVDTPLWSKLFVQRPEIYEYDDGVYKGTLYLKEEKWTLVPQSVVVDVNFAQYSNDPNDPKLNMIDIDEALRALKEKYGPNNKEGKYLMNPTFESFQWTTDIQSGSFEPKEGEYLYGDPVEGLVSHKREGVLKVRVDGYTYEAIYEGTISKPDDRVYKYQGYVTKPEVDTRIYQYVQLYRGTVVKPEVDTRVFIYEQTYTGEVVEEGEQFPETIEYNKDGYKGTLTKYGDPERKLISGEYLPADEKYIEGYDSPYYNENGYTGVLERYVASGSYTPQQSKGVSNRLGFYFLSDIPASVYYNENGYSGYLYRQNITTYTSTISDTHEICSASYTELQKDASAFEYLFSPSLYSEYISNPRIIGYSWIGDINTQTTICGMDYPYTRSIAVTINYDYYIADFAGTVIKPAEDTRVYKYRGIVKRPEIDTRKYSYVQEYRGTATKEGFDTRVYKYRGFVEKPEVDTRVFKYRGYVTKPATEGIENKYYQYLLNIQYEAWN